MPKETFVNLPEAKRQRLMELALQEFADHDYRVASLSRIVTRAGIAKGSIYQYFEGKQDLFLYLVHHASRTLLEAITAAPPPDGDLFTRLRHQMQAAIEAAAVHPREARLVERAFTAQLPFHDQVLEQGRALATDHFRGLVSDAIEREEIRPDADPRVAVFVLAAISRELGRYLAGELDLDPHHPDPMVLSSPRVGRILDQVVGILRHGLSA